jgi:hypothetical protein
MTIYPKALEYGRTELGQARIATSTGWDLTRGLAGWCLMGRGRIRFCESGVCLPVSLARASAGRSLAERGAHCRAARVPHPWIP